MINLTSAEFSNKYFYSTPQEEALLSVN